MFARALAVPGRLSGGRKRSAGLAVVVGLVAWSLLAGLSPGVGASAPGGAAPPCGGGAVEFLGFSDALNKATFGGTNVGGLSALVYDRGRDVYYSLVDNERETPARFYTLRLPLAGEGLGMPAVTAVTQLSDAGGQPFTGANFDGEGIVVLGGDLLIASETEPAIRRFGPDGTLRGELPVPDRF
ncbi:MAG: hypothetical protein AVDCRST_MAG88-1746, partial [uncultured Thermomicrobiales bacterium]